MPKLLDRVQDLEDQVAAFKDLAMHMDTCQCCADENAGGCVSGSQLWFEAYGAVHRDVWKYTV